MENVEEQLEQRLVEVREALRKRVEEEGFQVVMMDFVACFIVGFEMATGIFGKKKEPSK